MKLKLNNGCNYIYIYIYIYIIHIYQLSKLLNVGKIEYKVKSTLQIHKVYNCLL